MIVAERAVVVVPKTGSIIFARASDLRGAVASTQKLLTALVAVREGDLQKVVTIREEDLDCTPYHLGLQPGKKRQGSICYAVTGTKPRCK